MKTLLFNNTRMIYVPYDGITPYADIEQVRLDIRKACQYQVDALITSGWRFELPEEWMEPWQWKWRRPAKGKRRQGRLYHSTQQAHNQLLEGWK